MGEDQQGDKKDPKVRCRLVAKRLAAKYGGKDMEDLFAAMPPFEMAKALLVRSVQRRDRVKKVRRIMFIDVSKAHLYAPVDPRATAYVDCHRSAVSLLCAASCSTGSTG